MTLGYNKLDNKATSSSSTAVNYELLNVPLAGNWTLASLGSSQPLKIGRCIFTLTTLQTLTSSPCHQWAQLWSGGLKGPGWGPPWAKCGPCGTRSRESDRSLSIRLWVSHPIALGHHWDYIACLLFSWHSSILTSSYYFWNLKILCASIRVIRHSRFHTCTLIQQMNSMYNIANNFRNNFLSVSINR